MTNGAGTEAQPVDRRQQKNLAFHRKYAAARKRWINDNSYFHSEFTHVLRQIVEPGKRVLSLRCKLGFSLDAVQPHTGVGLETVPEFAEEAKARYPHLTFIATDDDLPSADDKFDYIIHEQAGELVDVQNFLERAHRFCYPHTRVILCSYNHLWELPIRLAERLGMKVPAPQQNWLDSRDLEALLRLADYEPVRRFEAVLFPKYIPVLSSLLNRCLGRLPLTERLSALHLTVCRPIMARRPPGSATVSVIVPCRNESSNVLRVAERVPHMGAGTEVIFCDDQSTDSTREEILDAIERYPEKRIRLVDGPAQGKAKNVWTGFSAASGDILMILDADLSVMPEQLPRFYSALSQGRGEFINGSRLVYPLAEGAMKWTNLIGNKFFSALFSVLLRQHVKDTLCGTKVLWQEDWLRLKPLIGTLGVEDMWGDHELLFGAARLNLRIVDLPVHYEERLFGATKMVRVLENGLRMLGLVIGGFWRLRFAAPLKEAAVDM